ncbi:DNA-directed RNA polymerase II subunit RPB1 [Cordyceps javanica]|uniref:DNA-directed RNA polymerase II subunit RPB1 n=1 Tax=Cordyceps javanica TaxID=43265 RepID=A0A545VA21_9HYPO|nr:DNA-directed RNA polymerase II subunit RPB1 [Cordyceps javanica]TQW09787.1 DNA-directed RNA polymerase II subunit RPB1 [Cordyceps javanica]
MNASALLTAQGWRGKGHSLHKTDDTVGLAKPLLLNRKDNTRGIGATQHFTSDQWWMNAFDEQLQGLDTSKKGKVVQTITTGKLNAIEKGSLGKYSLYTTFVSGGLLEGTIAALKKQNEDEDESEDDDESTSESESEPEPEPKPKPERDAAKKKSKKVAIPVKGSKEERKAARKEAKRKRRGQKAQLKHAARKSKTSKSKSGSRDDAAEEKRHRRARKEDKRRRRAQAEGK